MRNYFDNRRKSSDFKGRFQQVKNKKVKYMFRFESGENNNPIHDVFSVLRFRWLFSMKLL